MEMNRYEIVNWYSLKEIFRTGNIYPYEWGIVTNPNYFEDFLDSIGINFPDKLWEEGHMLPLVEKLFAYVYARYWNHYCFSLQVETNTPKDTEEAKEFWYKFLNIVCFTYDKYNDLLSYYASQLTKLMDGVKVSTTGQIRFNDTPQDITSVSDDKFASNLTKSVQESESGMNTPVERLKEIKDKFINVYLEWTNEFDKIFIEEGNI